MRRIIDFTLYVVIGLAVGFGALIWGDVDPAHATYASIRWIVFTFSTVIVSIYFLKDSKQYFTRKSFWLFFFFAAAAHLAVFLTIISRFPDLTLAWFCVMYPELLIVVALRDYVYKTRHAEQRADYH